ncbi:MAG: RlmE family RNA methyltransferase [Spirochaetales bacterium]|nr:RlmE family RNA methyltransferase [Spirochaetales bacterium]
MRNKPDHYSKKAKEQGYQARSVFKLEEIQNRHTVLRPGIKVLDLGAAPGSWSTYSLKKIGPKGFLVAVDLKPVDLPPKLKENYKVIQGSFKFQGVIEQIREIAPYNLIMSDAAPSTTGDRFVDTCRSFELARLVLDLAKEYLIKGGDCIMKIFQGGDEREILMEMKNIFENAKAFKPKSCRSESYETYFVGKNFKG